MEYHELYHLKITGSVRGSFSIPQKHAHCHMYRNDVSADIRHQLRSGRNVFLYHVITFHQKLSNERVFTRFFPALLFTSGKLNSLLWQ